MSKGLDDLGLGLSDQTTSRLSDASLAWLDEHLNKVKQRILKRAVTLAAEESKALGESPLDVPIDPKFVPEAAQCYAPGHLLPVYPPLPREENWWNSLLRSITGVTVIAAILALGFGALAVFKVTTDSAAFLDIAKVFAGAVVGSAGAVVASGAVR